MSKTTQQSRGFTIDYFQRLAQGQGWLGSLNVSVQNWRHNIAAFGGFDTAEFTLVEPDVSVEDWVANGLGRRIVAADETLSPMWEGFVDSITVTRSGLSITYGPISDIANRVFAIYSGVDTSVYPPVIGVRKKSPTSNDLGSQQIWGIWPEILSLAGVSDANSDLLVAMYMKERRKPQRNTNFSFGGGDNSMTVKCIGWYNTLRYPYNYTLNTGGTLAMTTRLQQILNAQPNAGWVSSDYSNLKANNTPVVSYQNDDQLALEQIKGYTAMGDESNNRWLFGVYEDRKAHHYPVQNLVEYQIFLRDPRQTVLDRNNAVVPAWRIRPGKWAFFADYMPGLGAPETNLEDDQRAILIENMQFDIRVPIEFQINGGHNSRYEQKSAKLGLRGIDV